jgi:hypothetical protein
MPDNNDDLAADDRDELAELRALAGRVRPEKVEWETPPADLWDRIAAEADLDPVDLDQTVADRPTLTIPGNSGLDDTGVLRPLADDRSEATDPDPDATAVIDTLALDLDETTVLPTLPPNLEPTGVVPPAPVVVDPDATAYNPTLPPVPVDADPDATAVNPTLPPVPVGGGTDPVVGSDAAPPATVTPIGAASSRRRPGGPSVPRWLLVAAAVLAVLGIGGIALNQFSSDDPDVVAESALERLGDATTGEGQAELIDNDGTLQLKVDTTDVDAGDGFLEVWVIDRDVTKLISLGPIRSDGTYDLPEGFDEKAFPIVDVSVEPIDGNPAHSGNSVLRGELQF